MGDKPPQPQLWEPGTQCYRNSMGEATTTKLFKTGNMEKKCLYVKYKRDIKLYVQQITTM